MIKLLGAESRKVITRDSREGNRATTWIRDVCTSLRFPGPQCPHPSKGMLDKVTCKDVINCARPCLHDTISFMRTFISVSGNRDVKKEKEAAVFAVTGN